MTKISILSAAWFACLVSVASGQTQTLLRVSSVPELPFTIGSALVLPDHRIIAASAGEAGGSDVALLDADGAVVSSFALPHKVAAMVASSSAERLFAVGSDGSNAYASEIDLGSDADAFGLRITTIALGEVPTLLSLALDEANSLYIADAASAMVYRLTSDDFKIARDGAVQPGPQVAFTYGGGVRSIAVSKAAGLAFVAGAESGELAAVSLDGANRVLDAYGRRTSDLIIPLAVTAAAAVEESFLASLVVADHRGRQLQLVDYNPFFETLDVAATTPMELALVPNSVVERVGETKYMTQPMLIATSLDQSAIVAGNVYSRQIVQYARGRVGSSSILERIGFIELPGTPLSLSLAPEGRFAAVPLAGSSKLVILTREEGEGLPTHSIAVRDLQRLLTELGFNVGAVDGISGPTTVAALAAFQRQTGLNFDLTDVDTAVAELRTYREGCTVVGLRCLSDIKSAVFSFSH
jgi:hypothetical protein